MSSFKGSYEYSVDSKGRINIPARMRKHVSVEANDTFIITRGYERCLFAYPLDEWNSLEQAVRKLSPSDPKHRFFERTLMQWATESPLDAQSRITLPRELLHFAGIENAALIIGVLERIEIWNPREYQEYLKTQGETYEEVAQRVFRQ